MTIKTLELLELVHRITGITDPQELLAYGQKILDWDAARHGPKPAIPTLSVTGGESVRANTISLFRGVIDFANCSKIQHPIKGPIDLKLYPYQRQYLECVNYGGRHKVVLHARQMGFTTLLAVHALWSAISQPNQTIVVASHKYGMAMEIINCVKFNLENAFAGSHLPDVLDYNMGTISFSNGSKIIARPVTGDSLRGLGATHILMDNAANVSYKNLREFWGNIDLTDTGPRIVIQSTPKWDEGPFHDLWNRRDQLGFQGHRFVWSDHPERGEAWAQHYRDSLGAAQFANQFGVEFLERPGEDPSLGDL